MLELERLQQTTPSSAENAPGKLQEQPFYVKAVGTRTLDICCVIMQILKQTQTYTYVHT